MFRECVCVAVAVHEVAASKLFISSQDSPFYSDDILRR